MDGNNRFNRDIVIVVSLTSQKLSINDISITYRIVARRYASIDPTYIITHCLNSKQSEKPVFCLENHINSLISYFKYMLLTFSYILKILISNDIRKRKCILVYWGPIYIPFIFIFKSICRLYNVDLGDWKNVLYWKTYYRYGYKFANIVLNIMKIFESISYIISDKIITNSYQKYYTLPKHSSGKVKLRFQNLNIRCTKSNIENKRDAVLYVGRLDYEKGIHILLLGYLKYLRRSIKTVNTHILQLIIAGDGPMRDLIIRVSNKIPYVVYKGYILRENNLSELYLKSKVLVIPSHTEGLPTVLLEGVKCKVPFILVNNSIWENIKAIKKIGKDVGVSLIDFIDSEDLASILMKLGRQ